MINTALYLLEPPAFKQMFAIERPIRQPSVNVVIVAPTATTTTTTLGRLPQMQPYIINDCF